MSVFDSTACSASLRSVQPASGTTRTSSTSSADPVEPYVLRAEPRASGAWRPTVWFNPWMYQSGEQIWAGLANEVICQLTGRMHPVEREAFWLELNLRRVDGDVIRRRIHAALLGRLIPLATAFTVVVVSAAVLAISGSVLPGLAG